MILQREPFYLQPPTVFCFIGHTGSSRSLVIELVGWRQRGLLPLLESVSCRLPTVPFAVEMSE